MDPLAWSTVVFAALFLVAAYGFYRCQRTLRDEAAGRRKAEKAVARLQGEFERFVYIASHDLQEPVRTIAGFGGLIEKRHGGELDSEAREFLGYIVSAAGRMSNMILSLLEYSRVHTAELSTVRFSMDSLLTEQLDALRQTQALAGAEVCRGRLPEVAGDPRLMGRAVELLLRNAAGLGSAEGRQVIHVGAREAEEEWQFFVVNGSIGIDRDELDAAFEPFRRLNGQHAGDTGMDLAICQAIVTRHGGRIWAESEPGAGSRFCFSVPR